MRLSSYLRADLVVTRLHAADREEVIRSVARHLVERDVVPSGEEVERGLSEREAAHSTAMGHGLALPHATLEGLPAPLLMVATTVAPVQFGPAGTDPVRVFFVLLSPPGHEREHIKMLARICRLVRDPGFMESLQDAPDPETALRIIERVDAGHV